MPSKSAAPIPLSQSILPLLEETYQFRVTWVETQSRRRLFHTDKGIFELHKADSDPNEIKYSFDVTHYLDGKGFNQLLPIQLPNTTKIGIWLQDQFYVLTKSAKGHKANLLHAEEREKSLKCLARFHCLSEGFHRETGTTSPNFPDWKEVISHKMREFAVYRLHAPAFNKEDLEIWKIAKKAYQVLTGSLYESAVVLEKNRSGVCHGNLLPDDLVIDGESYLKLPESLVLRPNFRIYDLVCCLRHVMRQTAWDHAVGTHLLRDYEACCPLTDVERQLLHHWLLFPWDYIEAAKQTLTAARKKDTGESERIHYRFTQERAHAQNRQNFARRLLE